MISNASPRGCDSTSSTWSRRVCLTADLSPPTETDLFRDTFPERFHNIGIEGGTTGYLLRKYGLDRTAIAAAARDAVARKAA